MGLARPCLTCGEPTSLGSYCRAHRASDSRPTKSRKAESARYAARDPDRYGPDWAAKSRAVLQRDGFLCQLQLEGCTGRATTADHIVPVSRGGGSELSNLQAACRHCNSKKGNRR